MKNPVLKAARRMSINHNVSLRVLDPVTGECVQEHEGHNAATNSLLTGIGHYLTGDGILNQGYDMLERWVPKYISLGTMGLHSQAQDAEGLPLGIGTYKQDTEVERFIEYMTAAPGFGADGYDKNRNNGRAQFGLGPQYSGNPVGCELISPSFPRSMITFRDVIPETEAELPQTIDIVFSALVSTGALSQFREYQNDYIFITEAGLWSTNYYTAGGDNGLLAGYRIMPLDEKYWDMNIEANRNLLKHNILKVKRNQVVQVIWKIQLGGIDDVAGIEKLYPEKYKIHWREWDGKQYLDTKVDEHDG